jgi:predicted dehydrogenase
LTFSVSATTPTIKGVLLMPLRVLIVGAGMIAQGAHIPNLLRLGVEVEGLVEVNPQRAKEVAQRFGIQRVWHDYRVALKESLADAVVVATPTKFHYGVTMEALRVGKHVLCEKPPAMFSAEAYEMANEAERRNLTLMWGFHLRFRDDALSAKWAIDNGELGDVYFVRARWVRSRGAPAGWFCRKDLAGGGPLFDIGSHIIDLGWWLLGKPKMKGVYGYGFFKIGAKGVDLTRGHQPADVRDGIDLKVTYDVEDYAGGHIIFEGGKVLLYEVSWLLNDRDDFKVTVCGTNMGLSFTPLEFYMDGGVYYDGKDEGEAHFRLAEEFVRGILHGQSEIKVGAVGWDGYEVMVMLERASQFLNQKGGHP